MSVSEIRFKMVKLGDEIYIVLPDGNACLGAQSARITLSHCSTRMVAHPQTSRGQGRPHTDDLLTVTWGHYAKRILLDKRTCRMA